MKDRIGLFVKIFHLHIGVQSVQAGSVLLRRIVPNSPQRVDIHLRERGQAEANCNENCNGFVHAVAEQWF